MRKVRSSTSKEIKEIADVAPKRAMVVDFLCKRDKFHDDIVKTGWHFHVVGASASLLKRPPYSFKDNIIFKEKFKVAWWNIDMDKAIFYFADGFSVKRDIDKGALISMITLQLQQHFRITKKKLKFYLPRHFIDENVWLAPLLLPDNASRLSCVATWVSGGRLWDVTREVVDKTRSTKADFARKWDRRYGVVCPYDTESLVWLTHLEVSRYNPGRMKRDEFVKKTRLKQNTK